ncbi:uncharacterized protein LOC141685221 [Apium graveolens]|uniref:uncharacterized protein LOC141685221 n=1 Tax=Apium graveolens TaxID=4045 RepID=UPI003D79D0C7
MCGYMYNEKYSSFVMEGTSKIIRSSVYIFLSNYLYFTISALFAFPFSATILITQALVPYTSLLPPIQNRLQALLYAAALPPSSQFFNILSLKLSQTITSSILVLPFAFSFLLIAKASIIKALSQKPSTPPKIYSIIPILSSIFSTQIYNSLLLISVNATSITIISIAFNCLNVFNLLSTPTSLLLFSAAAAILYSIFLANALIISNLALVSSGMETEGGYMSIIKACVLIRGRNSKAISLALPLNIALAAIEALFQYRVVAAFSSTGFPTFSMTLEWLLIAYLYSIFIVLDTIVSCMFFKSCKTAFNVEDQESSISHYIDISQEDQEYIISFSKLKTVEVLP